MKLSHLNGLRALEATLRNGTFTAAAEELGVSVAAIGQQIRGLEDYLDLRLFERRPSGVQPAKEALSVATRLTVGFSHITDALGDLERGRQTGRLRIAMSHFILDDWLAERMPGFHRRHQGIKVSYDVGESYVDLLNSDVDMAIRFSPEPGPEYAFDHLHNGCFMPLCTPEFAAKHGLRPGKKDLSGVPLYQFHDVTTDPEWIGWPDLLKRHAISKNDPGPVQQISGYRVALSGEGLVLCGLTESFNDLKEGRLVAPLGPELVAQFSYGYRLVWPAGRALTRPMRLFRRWILGEREDFLKEASRLLGCELS